MTESLDTPRELAVDGALLDDTPQPKAGSEVSAEDMGAASFPASDPPATWTWDPR
jgi:hypothetical protein